MPLLGWALLTPAQVQAVVEFGPARHDFVCGRLARDVAPIDFNSDGHLDLACVRFTVPGVVTLLEGDGRGNFRFFSELPAGDGSTAILSADLNEDGHPDLVTAGFVDGPNGTIGLHLGDGQGNFSYEALPFAPGIAPFQVNAADLDGDHHVDLVAGGTGDGAVRIFNGNGLGGFTPGLILTGAQVPQQAAIGDIDGDRDPDLAVADNMGDVLLYRNDGAGGFGPAVPLEVGREPVWIDIRTFEDRARPYLAVALRTESTVEVFQWNPASDAPLKVTELPAPFSPICVTFLEPTLFHDPSRPGGGPQDTSRRRLPGLAVVSQTSSQVRIWRSLDQSPLELAAQDSPTAIRLGDWNEDKLPDFAIPGFNTESVSLFVGGKALAESAPFAPVDSLPIQILPVTMNADPVPDFAILRRTARVLTALVGRNDGTFESRPIGKPFPDVPTGMAVFNLEDEPVDGLQPDFAVGRAVGSELWILGSAKQYERDTIFMAGTGPTSMKAADLDLDGHDDLIASLFLSDNLSVHFGRGGSGFEVGIPVQVGDGPFAIDAADLNNNGLLDLVVANHDGLSFTVVLQTLPRVLTPSLPVPTAVGFPRGIAIGQLTDDLVPDVALGGELGLEVFAGDGAGGFTSALFVPTAAEFETVRITDLDGDGGVELVAADRLGAAIVVLAGQVPQAGASGPGGGQVLLDLPQLSFGVEFGPSDFALTELNGDGAPDLAVVSPLAGRMTMLFGRHSIPGRRLGIEAQGAPELGAEVRLGPNPFTDQTTFRITGSDRRRVWLRIFDPQGRCVASPFSGAIGPEAIDVRWNGLDSRGRAVPGGIYFYRLESTGVRPVAGKLVRF